MDLGLTTTTINSKQGKKTFFSFLFIIRCSGYLVPRPINYNIKNRSSREFNRVSLSQREKCGQRLGEIIGCKNKTSSWHLNRFPYGSNIGSTFFFFFFFFFFLIHTFSVLSLQLKKLRGHNKSAIDLSNANPACGHKEVRRSTGHIMVTTRHSDQQGSKSRQKVMRLYKQWHRPISKRFIKPPYSIREQPRSTRNVVAYPRPAFSAKNRKNYAPTSFDQQVQVSQGHTFCTEIRKIEIPRSMVVEALNW